ncbi:MAG: ribonuclease HII [Opitutae bacterium]|nr:ribonuclease HII [Opitutae bacterium]
MPNPRWTYDRKLSKGRCGVVGVDEAGRGCLAGPVVAGCVILPASFFQDSKNRKTVEEINDSKKFLEEKRESLFLRIQKLIESKSVFGATGSASVAEIEEHNIVGATCLAMQRAMESVSQISNKLWKPEISEGALFKGVDPQETEWAVLVDGKPMKKLNYYHQGLVKGDSLSLAVSMASLLAKVTRDQLMKKLDLEFPDYGFASNKGYGAPVHLRALRKLGATTYHRPRFLRNLLSEEETKSPVKNVQTQLSLI